MDRNNVRPISVSINTNFLNCLQPEWSKYVTMVRHNQTGEIVSYDMLYDSLVQFEPHVLASKPKKAAKNHDPLALIAHSNVSSSQSHANSSYSPQPYYVTHPSSVVNYEDEYQGVLQGDSKEDKLITAMMLLARAITQKFSTPTNNRLRTSSNTKNQAIIQDGRVDKQTKNAGYSGNGNKNAGDKARIKRLMQEMEMMTAIRLFSMFHETNHLRERQIEKMLLAMKDEAGSNINNEGNDFMLDTSYGEETMEELTDAVMLMARIQPADSNAETVPSYDAKSVSEVNASSKVHEKILHEKRKTIIQTSDDEQIDYNIIFDDPCVENNGGTSDHASNDHEEYHKIQILAYDVQREAGLGYKNPERLKKAIAAQPKMYDGEKLHSTKLVIDSPNSEETLEDAEEIRLKLRNKMVQINYVKLNALNETFAPQQDFSMEQTYFLIPSTYINGSESKAVTSDLPILKMPKEGKLLEMFDTLGVKSSNSVRRPMSKGTKSKNIVLKNTNAKRSTTHVRKMSRSVSIDCNKCEIKDSNVCQTNASGSNSKTVNAVNNGSNIFCVSCREDVFFLSHEKCVARNALSRNSNVKRALFTTLATAKSKNLGTTLVVMKSGLSVTNTPKATNKEQYALGMIISLQSLDMEIMFKEILRFVTMWDVNSATGWYLSTNFIVSDEKGNLMHCTARGNIAHNFLWLKKGAIYFVKNFTVQPNKDDFHVLRFAHFVVEMDGDTIVCRTAVKPDGFAHDVGYVTNVGRTTTTRSGSKTIDFHLANNRGQSMRVTLWGGLGEMLIEKRTRHVLGIKCTRHSHCQERVPTGNPDLSFHHHVGLYPVVLIALSVKLYNNRLYLSSTSSTMIVDDEQIFILKQFKSDDSGIEIAKELLPEDSIGAKPGTLENLLMWARCNLSLFVRVDKIRKKRRWNYPSCGGEKCKKGNLDRKHGRFWCDSCHSSVDYPVLRYRLELEVSDDTAQTGCGEMLGGLQDEEETGLPPALANIVGTLHTLELKSNSYYEHANYESFTCWRVVVEEALDESRNIGTLDGIGEPKAGVLVPLTTTPSVSTPSKPGEPKKARSKERHDSDGEESFVADSKTKGSDVGCSSGTRKWRSLGGPTYACPNCNATMWYEERNNKGNKDQVPRFSNCYQQGKVLLPQFKDTPEPLKRLLDYTQPATSIFRDLIRVYNEGVDGTIVGSLIRMLDTNSSIAKSFRMERDWCHANVTVNVELHLLSEQTSSKQYNVPTVVENYQDAMALCRAYGNPGLFITFTSNPKWHEITKMLAYIPGQRGYDRPEVGARVFKLKLTELLDDLTKNHVFGATRVVVFVIEFHKRGLPHAHILLWIEEYYKFKAATDIDDIISAELSSPTTNLIGYKAVSDYMLHGPCRKDNRAAACNIEGKCSKHFPKPFYAETVIDHDVYPIYRRSDDKVSVKKGNITFDNKHVVLHNRYLLLKYQAQINVEWCNRSKVIKYLFKYLNKGPDGATIIIQENVQQGHGMADQKVTMVDEIKNYLNCCYLAPCNASLLLPGGRIAHSSPRQMEQKLWWNDGLTWGRFQVSTLKRSMRVNEYNFDGALDTQKQIFNQWVLAVGDGKVPARIKDREDEPTWIEIPETFLIPSSDSPIQQIVKETNPNFIQTQKDDVYIRERAILNLRNDDADEINAYMFYKLAGQAITYHSANEI
nr:hypothetical protein [Tanacetum cinerariifolium]